eukprot:760542-Prorocentrum_minimum.AAC.1
MIPVSRTGAFRRCVDKSTILRLVPVERDCFCVYFAGDGGGGIGGGDLRGAEVGAAASGRRAQRGGGARHPRHALIQPGARRSLRQGAAGGVRGRPPRQ